MSTKTTTTTSGVSFTGLLAVLFIGLKLTGYITWSWWWVLSPIWIPFILFILIFVAIGIGITIANAMN